MRIDEHLMERERAEIIRRAIMSLPEKQRAAVLLHKYEEMDYGEIAKNYGLFGKRAEVAAVSRVRDTKGATGAASGAAGSASRRGRKAVMKCENISKELIAYLDRRANSAERSMVEEHLAECAACQARAEEFRKLWSVMDEMPVIEPSLGFDARVRQRVAAEPRERWFGWLVPQPRLAFSMAFLLAADACGSRSFRSTQQR